MSLCKNCAFTVSREQKRKHKAFLCSEYSATENISGSVSVIRQQSRTETFNVPAGKVHVYLSGKKINQPFKTHFIQRHMLQANQRHMMTKTRLSVYSRCKRCQRVSIEALVDKESAIVRTDTYS